MANKLYSKFKKFLKNNYIYISIIFVFILVFIIPVPYSIEIPGGLIDVNDKITMKNEKYTNTKGSLNLTYVTTLYGNVLTFLTSIFNRNWDAISIKNDDYNEKDNTYTSSSGCGGDSCDFKDVVSKIYKAEKDPNEEYIYVYSYTQKVEGKCDSNFETIETYLVDKNDTKTKTLYTEDAGQYSEKYKSTINEMIDNKEVETYKWTFKKQSDGKYYFYSGEWQ